ncbi:hypothetical protein CDAR_515621 [Caerostris darwini]|uniref:Uncharacterized protein n=1 Tax=Caerostris darwini TaxID=1538125 RepID=A0AAV4RZW5_9ARAC|nr:hypothetical protein CDAR_515621 [Caerostris darwini]
MQECLHAYTDGFRLSQERELVSYLDFIRPLVPLPYHFKDRYFFFWSRFFFFFCVVVSLSSLAERGRKGNNILSGNPVETYAPLGIPKTDLTDP